MIAIIKYNSGNINSVQNAINKLGYNCMVTDCETEILKADKVIFPGVGEASSAMLYLKKKGLDKTLLKVKQPFMGICLGLQLMCNYSEEGNTTCLGIFNTEVKKFPNIDIVPHMGWNILKGIKQNSLLQGIEKADDVYFVHSYYAEPCEETLAEGDYIIPFSAVLQKDNYYACQFHPEKSSIVGEQILKNFLEL